MGKSTLGAAGLGWEVWCDGMEITQFTYFQQMTGLECKPKGNDSMVGRLACSLRKEKYLSLNGIMTNKI